MYIPTIHKNHLWIWSCVYLCVGLFSHDCFGECPMFITTSFSMITQSSPRFWCEHHEYIALTLRHWVSRQKLFVCVSCIISYSCCCGWISVLPNGFSMISADALSTSNQLMSAAHSCTMSQLHRINSALPKSDQEAPADWLWAEALMRMAMRMAGRELSHGRVALTLWTTLLTLTEPCIARSDFWRSVMVKWRWHGWLAIDHAVDCLRESMSCERWLGFWMVRSDVSSGH